MNRLPTELLHHIFDSLPPTERHTTMNSMSLLAKRYTEPVRLKLFQSVYIILPNDDDNDVLQDFAETCDRVKIMRTVTKELTIRANSIRLTRVRQEIELHGPTIGMGRVTEFMLCLEGLRSFSLVGAKCIDEPSIPRGINLSIELVHIAFSTLSSQALADIVSWLLHASRLCSCASVGRLLTCRYSS